MASYNLDKLAEQAMGERNFSIGFSKEALAQLESIHSPLSCTPAGIMRDLRSKPWISIDNEETEDLDQLTYVEMTPEHALLYVAVADVDSLVTRGSPLDSDAQMNATTVYTPSRNFPMLPDKLSHNFTSFKAGADRLAIIVEASILKEGKIGAIHFYQACVRNHAKLSYNKVTEWLKKRVRLSLPPQEAKTIQDQLILQDKIAKKIRTYRHQHGALTLETRDIQPILSEEKVVAIRPVSQNRAEEIIEDFMIVCNVAATQYLHKRGMPTLMRIVREPKNWPRIVEIAKERGVKLTHSPNAKVLELFLLDQKRKDPNSFPDLSFNVIKLLGRGEYIVQFPGEFTPGHFGLALRNYTHATAPNRRYADLLTQRLIKMAMHRSPLTYSREELNAIAKNCTIKEEAAEKVERRIKKSAAAIFLSSKMGSTFPAFVTGASKKECWVRISRPFIEGRLVEGFQHLKVGQKITVKLISVDIEKGYIDFAKKQGVK